MTPPMTPREKVAPSLSDLLRQAVETMKSWTPEQREAHFEAQKKAWVAAEMAFGDEGTRAVTALALAERVLPGWGWELYAAYEIKGSMKYGCNLGEEDTAYAFTPALALCIAILRAKAQEG